MKFFDAHFHIINPAYPLVANQGYLPEAFTAEDYTNTTQNYQITGGAIVSGSFQAFDQTYLIDSLEKLGPKFVGVTNLSSQATDKEILTLSEKGIRAVRFNLYRGGSETVNELRYFADRIYSLCKMHIELYISGEQINQHFDLLKTLPKISIDHLGMTDEGRIKLLALVEKGAKVKATGFMRVNFDVVEALQAINSVNPGALMFGTDLPGTRASRTFSKEDIALIQENFSEIEQQNIFYKNAQVFYQLHQ